MNTIDVGHSFHFRLVNRDQFQGDGKHSAVQFREAYLSFLDSQNAWKDDIAAITLDFKNVRKIGPSFANEAFAYFMKYTTPERFKKKVKFINMTEIIQYIIDQEIDSGYER